MHEEELSSNIPLSDSSYLGLMLTDYDWEWSRIWPLNKKNDADLEVNLQAFGSFPKHFKSSDDCIYICMIYAYVSFQTLSH